MPTVVRNGRSIHHSLEGDGPGLVLIPGLGSGARLFGTLPRRFARLGFRCAAIDPVGLEPSSSLPGGVFDFAEAALDTLAVAATLPAPVTLVGTSLGGKVALCAAAMQSEAAHRLVMLCSSAVHSARQKRIYRWFELLCTEVEGRLLGELTAPFLFGETFLGERPGVVDDIVRSTKPSAASRAFMQAQVRALQAFDGSSLCSAVACPTLCMAGEEDTLTLPRDVMDTATRIPGAVYRGVARAGHSLMLESKDAVDLVADFARDR